MATVEGCKQDKGSGHPRCRRGEAERPGEAGRAAAAALASLGRPPDTPGRPSRRQVSEREGSGGRGGKRGPSRRPWPGPGQYRAAPEGVAVGGTAATARSFALPSLPTLSSLPRASGMCAPGAPTPCPNARPAPLPLRLPGSHGRQAGSCGPRASSVAPCRPPAAPTLPGAGEPPSSPARSQYTLPSAGLLYRGLGPALGLPAASGGGEQRRGTAGRGVCARRGRTGGGGRRLWLR